MGIKYKVYREEGLLVDVFEGNISLSDIMEIYRIEHENIDFFTTTKAVSDIRKAKFKISLDEVKSFIKFMQNPNNNTNFRWAVLAQNPMQTALSILVRMDNYYRDIFKVFSTLEGCNTFLKTNYTEENFNESDFIIVK